MSIPDQEGTVRTADTPLPAEQEDQTKGLVDEEPIAEEDLDELSNDNPANHT